MTLYSLKPSFIFLLFSLLSQSSFAEGVPNEAGQLHFITSVKAIDEYREDDFIQQIELNSSKNLYFVAFLQQPLSNYLIRLAPDKAPQEVINQGNYHFTFLVNDTVVYTEALNLGAGTPAQKNQDKVLLRPFYSERNEDSWGRFLWMRFMHFGGEEALSVGTHKLKLEVRPYLKSSELVIGEIIAQGQLKINVVKPEITAEQVAVQPIAKNSGWPLSQDNFDQSKIIELNTRISQNDFKDISGIVVIKNGELLLEQYFNDAQRGTLHDARSVGKSFASTVLGIAIADGHIASPQQTLGQFYDLTQYANYSHEKTQITLEQLMTLSSDFVGNDADSSSIGNEENMYPSEDWVRFTLDLPLHTQPRQATSWRYFTAGVVLLGDIIHKTVPGGLERYADETLFKPLGIEQYQWQHTPQGVANTAGGIQLRALDFAKYGQLYKNEGRWQDKQILPTIWVEASLSKQVMRGDNAQAGHYGYLFWHDQLMLNDQLHDVAYATGNGGNKIFIFKDLPFVIVVTASAYNKSYAHHQVNQMMRDYILPAIID